MIPAKWDRKDPAFLAWVHEQPLRCLFCGRTPIDFCHVQHGSHRRSDYLGYPACHWCHMQLDHGPRSAKDDSRPRLLREGYVRESLAVWFTWGLPDLLARYKASRARLEAEEPGEGRILEYGEIAP